MATTIAALVHEPVASAGEAVRPVAATSARSAEPSASTALESLPPEWLDEMTHQALAAIPGVVPKPGRLEPPPPRSSPSAADLALRRPNVATPASRGAARAGSPLSVWPAGGAVSGTYGEPRARHRHAGIDLDAGYGAPVVASGPGTVVAAGWASSAYAGYGQIVIIDHGNGVQSLSAHLSSVAVAVGQAVAAGEHVGAVGTTGQVTGPHLHFEVRLGGTPVDPLHWLPAR